MSAACAIVVTTVDDEDKANEIARSVVAQGLAACVQVSGVRSIYRWKGEVEETREFRLEMKMRAEDYAALETAIRALHPYETPEIVRVDIAEGYKPYLDWIAERG